MIRPRYRIKKSACRVERAGLLIRTIFARREVDAGFGYLASDHIITDQNGDVEIKGGPGKYLTNNSARLAVYSFSGERSVQLMILGR